MCTLTACLQEAAAADAKGSAEVGGVANVVCTTGQADTLLCCCFPYTPHPHSASISPQPPALSPPDGLWLTPTTQHAAPLCHALSSHGLALLSLGGSQHQLPPVQGPSGASGGGSSEQQQSGLPRAEALLAQAQKALAARQADADAAAQALRACEQRLAEAKAEQQGSKVKQQSPQSGAAGSSKGANGHLLANGNAAAAGGAVGVAAPSPLKEELDAKFALPERLREYTGGGEGRG